MLVELKHSGFQDEAIVTSTQQLASAPRGQSGDKRILGNPFRTNGIRNHEAISVRSRLVGKIGKKKDGLTPYLQQASRAEGAATYPRSPLDSAPLPLMALSYPNASRTQSSSKHGGAPRLPHSPKATVARASMTLPDSWELNQSSPLTVRDRSTSDTRCNIGGKRGSISVPFTATRPYAERQGVERVPGLRDKEASKRRTARRSYVLNTPRDLANAVHRVFEVRES